MTELLAANVADKNMMWLRKRKFWGPIELNGLWTAAHTMDETFNAGEIIVPPRGGTGMFLMEVSDYGIVGLQYSVAAAGDGGTRQ